jgi:hypothetical protein
VIAICNASGKTADGSKHDFKNRQSPNSLITAAS